MIVVAKIIIFPSKNYANLIDSNKYFLVCC